VEIAVPLLEQALETVPARRFVEGMLALALVECGELERATAIFDANMIEGVESLPDDTLYRVTAGLLVEVGILLRRVDRINDLARWIEALPDYPHIFTGGMYLGATDRLRGGVAHLKGEDAEAESFFRAALDAEAAIDAKPMLAATRLDWADMLLDSGDREGARALAEAALEDIGDLPLLRQRRRAEATLERSDTD
jgi:tetratricopeptide (TPR) repeat protein